MPEAETERDAANLSATPQEVRVASSRELDFRSAVSDRDYRLQIALPLVPPPDRGYPVLYVLDGFAYFASAADCVRANANAPQVAVVGIGYPTSQNWVDEILERGLRDALRPTGSQALAIARRLARTYDLTLPASDRELAAQRYPGAAEQLSSDVGGLTDFLRVIETEIKPRVAAIIPVDPSNQVLFGHSLGGLAALHALFLTPQAFNTFIVASPSIWWNGGVVLKGERGFSAAVHEGRAAPRVLITAGALEGQRPSHVPLPAGVSTTAIAERIATARMVDNARDLAARLRMLAGKPSFEVAEFLEFPNQGHGVSAWSALAAGVAFAFQGGARN